MFSQYYRDTKQNNFLFIKEIEKLFKNNPQFFTYNAAANKIPSSYFVSG